MSVSSGIIKLLLVFLCFALLTPAAPAAAQDAPAWRTTALRLAESSPLCFDPARPGVAIVRQPEGTLAFNWRTGERTLVNPLPFERCAADGTLFASEGNSVRRFSVSDPQGRTIERMPTHMAEDGAPRLYQFTGDALWASEDGGASWEQRILPPNPAPPPLSGTTQFVVSSGDSRALYALASFQANYTRVREIRYSLYASRDSGVTWEERTSGSVMCPSVGASIWRAPGALLPADHIGLTTICSGRSDVGVSNDGGRTFNQIGVTESDGSLYTVSTAAGLLRFQSGKPFARSADGGATWVALPNSPRLMALSQPTPLEASPVAPNYVFARSREAELWYSSDNGSTWGRIEGRTTTAVGVAPHNPPALATIMPDAAGNYLAVYDFGDAPEAQRCFVETGLCMSGRIKEFWEQNGGLRVFGFPITAQREEQIEGQSVQVQWFERARLELHPRNPRPYDVLLGRIGVERLAAAGRNWRTFPQGGPQAGCRFFPESGQSICGRILDIWRASGIEIDNRRGISEAESLALFGLPLSPLVDEILSDGNAYRVQWFERGRIELHPDQPRPYDVQIGLLGRELIERR